VSSHEPSDLPLRAATLAAAHRGRNGTIPPLCCVRSRTPGAEGEPRGMGARARRGAFRVSRRSCLACGRDATEFFRGGVCAKCWDELPRRRTGDARAATRRSRRRPSRRSAALPARSPGVRAAARGGALPRLGARGPARLQVRGADYLAPRMADRDVRAARRYPTPTRSPSVPATARARRARGLSPRRRARSRGRARSRPAVRPRAAREDARDRRAEPARALRAGAQRAPRVRRPAAAPRRASC
jgi:hypothetical protein